MTRSELEHLLWEPGSIADDKEIVVIGSQSVLGQFPNAPAVLLASMVADIFPLNRPERTDLIDASIGKGSRFHESFGYYAQGVYERTVILLAGWQKRLVAISNHNTSGVTGRCLDVHDLAVSKYIAGREKDLLFTRGLAKPGLTDESTLSQRLAETTIDKPLRNIVAARIARDFATLKARGGTKR